MDDASRSESYSRDKPSWVALPARRVVVRAAVCLGVLIAIDLFLAHAMVRADIGSGWRMPRALPTSQLAPAIEHIERVSAASEKPLVVFVGASPAWGDAVASGSQAVPAAYERAARSDGTSLNAFNLASNGQLVGDSYFLTKKVAEKADLVVVQLTYHGFNAEWREGATQRFPELPRLLGLPVEPGVAKILGADATPGFDAGGTADRWLRSRWRLYAQRDSLAGQLLGVTPETALFERWETLVDPELADIQESAPTGEPFDSLEPDEQLRVLDEFSMAGDFELDPDDSEVAMLERLASDLEASGVKALFYLSPLNIAALESHELLDREVYGANVAPLKAIVEEHGHRFLDLGASESVPATSFADINHTTSEGNELVGRMLWEATRDLIGSEAAR